MKKAVEEESLDSEGDANYGDETEEINHEKEKAAEPKKRGRPRKVVKGNPLVGGAAKSAAIDQVVNDTMKTFAVTEMLEKIRKKNKIKTLRTVKGGIKLEKESVMENFVSAIADIVTVGAYEENITAEGLDSFKNTCQDLPAIRAGLNGMVQIAIAAVDSMVICDRDIFSNVKGSGLTNLVQSVMSKL